VMIGHDGRARLIDLGIVQSNESRAQRTESGAVRGTIRYLAPELFAGERHSVQTDVWALGVVLWEALIGREAVQGTPAAAVGRICTGNIMVLQEGEQVDGRVQRAIAKLLKKEPRDRPQRARDAAAIFSMIEKDLAGERDIETEMAQLVAARVGPCEIDDPSTAHQIASRARAMFVHDKLATTGVAEVMASIVSDLGSAETSKEHTLDPQPLPRLNTPPGSPGAHIQHYVKLLAALERPKA
jgi:serine/threonine protein kinase